MIVQVQKAIIIEQFKQVDDINLKNAIKNLLDYAKENEQEIFDIPEAHQKIAMEQFDKVRKNPERLVESKNTTKKQMLSERFAGCITKERADELQTELIQMRKEGTV